MFFENRFTRCWFWKKNVKPKKTENRKKLEKTPNKNRCLKIFATKLKQILYLIREFGSRDLESQKRINRGRVTSLGALTSLKKPETMSPAASPRDRLSKEIETYVFFPVVDGDDDSLCWWKLNDHKLPMLGQLARRYLAIQATSSA